MTVQLSVKEPLQLRLAGRSLRVLLAVIVAAAVATLVVERLWLACVQPLWFDEAWGVFVATSANWRAVAHEARVDVNAPLYYFLLHAWTAIAGPSNFAFRMPGLLAVVAAGIIPLTRPVPGLAFEGRVAWGVMIFAWWGVDVFLAGRCYGLLLALTTLQCILFSDLLRAPSRRSALAWGLVGSAAILTHYYALFVTCAQGVVYLAARRERALQTWPAALAFVPAFAWLAWHAPRLEEFGAAGVAWHARMDTFGALAMTAFAFNPSSALAGLAVAFIAAPALLWVGLRNRAACDEGEGYLWTVAAASVAALLLTLISGGLHPSLTARYLMPTVPGILLGLVLLAGRTSRPKLAWAALTLAYLATAVRPAAFIEGVKGQSPYGFETASEALIRHGVTDVVFVWDHEVTAITPGATLQGLGSVFFRRAGAAVRLTPLIVRPSDDINTLALAAATGPRPGIIWIYNRRGRTAAAVRPPRIPELDRRWRCQRIGDEMVGSLACWRD